MPLSSAPAPTKNIINQWLCIAFISLLCFWVVLFYFTESTQSIAQQYIGARNDLLR